MKNYLYYLKISLFLGALCVCMNSVQATHITGAELTYECINPATNQYRVEVTVYRDCLNGQANFDNNIRLFMFRGSNGSLFNTVSIPLTTNGVQIIPVEWDACTGAPFNLCIEYTTYSTTITLPPLVGGYDIGWARCCRNNVVTNVFNNQGITVLGHVPSADVMGCNSMPLFNSLPPIFLCVGQSFNFDHSATDADGDSLVYSISNPYTGTNFNGQGATQFNPVVNLGGFNNNPMGPPPYNNINYINPFNFTDPFGSGNFSMDPQSGLLTLTPTQTGLSVFAVSVKEYRDGILLSENKRDFQINVITCAPQGIEPVINSPPLPVGGDTIYVDPLESFCYTINVSDPDPADTVVLFPVSAAFGIGNTAPPPYATISYNGINPANGTVCWTPPCENEGDTILLIVGGQDTSDCPGYNIVFDTTWVIIDTFANPLISHTIPGGGSNDTITIDPLVPFCYNFDASDIDPDDTLEIVPISGPFQGLGGIPPLASINYSGINPLTGQVCWTPGCSSAGKTSTFIIAAQDANYCQKRAYDTVTVVINPLPPTGVNADTTMCVGESYQLQAFGGTAYVWTPNFGLSNNTIANPIATPGGTIAYSVAITDSVGCPQSHSVIINVNQLPPADAGLDVVKCPNTTVQLQASGGITYSWTPATDLSNPSIPNPIANPLDTVTYTLTVTDANGCVNTDQVTITPMYAVPGPNEVICVGDSVQISATGGVSYQWNPAISLSNPLIPNPIASPISTTAYTVVVTGSTGCVDSTQVNVTVNPLPPANAGPDTDLCIGSSIPLQATGGVTYAWSPGTGLSNPSIANPSANPVISTGYEVTVTDANGCVNTDSIDIIVNPLPTPFAGNDTIKCGNTGIQLTATGGVSYSWTPALGLNNPNSQTPIANPDSTTMYTVVVTDANGCQNEDSVLVTALHADAGPDKVICIGQSVQLEAGGGLVYNWDNPTSLSNPAIADPIASPTVTTTYTVTITFPTGCTDTDQVTVVVNPLPLADAGPIQPLCIGDTLQLQASGGTTYVWNADPTLSDPLIANPLVFPLDTTSYVVTVTDANGCVNTDTTTVLVNLLPIVEAGNDTTKCGEVGVQLSATGGVNFQWSPLLGLNSGTIPSPIANPDSSTMYYVAITDTNGCVNVDSVFVQAMYADAGPDVPLCIGDTLQLAASGGISYQWDANADLNSLVVSDPLAYPVNSSEFYVEVTDATGCTDRDTVQVTVNPLPITSTAGTDPYVCSGGGTQVFATGGVTYQWMPPGIFSDPTIANPIASPTYFGGGAGLDSTWTFYVMVIDSNGCQSLDSLDQVVRLLPIISVSNDTVKCPGDTISLLATGGAQYLWTPPYAINDPTLANPLISPDTTTTYQALVTAVWGCSDSSTVTVDVINPDAGPDATICAEDSVQLLATGGVSYVWDNAATLTNANIPNPIAFPLVTTDYIVTVTDSAGCVDVDTMTVFVNQLPPANAGPDTAICIGDSIQITATGGTGYQWLVTDSMDNPLLAAPTLFPIQTTTYIVDVTDANLCRQIDSMVLTVNLLPIADAGPDVTKCGEDSIQLTATGGVQYLWMPTTDLSDPMIANPMAVPDSNSSYSVIVTDINGCVNTDTMNILTMYADAGQGDTICFGDTIQLGASHIGGLAVGYSWQPDSSVVSPFVSNPLVFPTVSTDYIVAVTDSSGCVDTNAVHIEVLPPPPASAGPDLAICIFDSVQLVATGGIAYLWSPNVGLSDPTIPNPIANPLATISYTVMVTDTNGCTALDTMLLTVNPLPIADAGQDVIKCGEDSVQLQATGGIQYLWTPFIGLGDQDIANPMASPDSNTLYTVIVTDGNGCSSTDSIQVNTMYADAGPDQLKCPEDDVQLQASTIGGFGTAYLWSPTNDLSSTIISNPIASPILTTEYVVEIRDASGCTDTDTVTVHVHIPPPAFAGTDTAICIGESTTLRASGGVSYSWSPDTYLSNPNIVNPLVTPETSTTYVVNVTDINGCQATDDVTVTVNELPIVRAGEDLALCRRDFVQLQASGAVSYEWSPSQGLSTTNIDNPQASPDITTNYTVIGTDRNGCQNTDDMVVTVFQLPIVTAQDYYEICVGQAVELSAEGGAAHLWSTGEVEDQISVSPALTETFWTIPLSEEGCEGDTFYVDVYVERNLPRAEFRPSLEEGFYPLEVTFENQSRNATQYIWDFGSGDSASGVNIQYTFELPGDYEVTLIADNDIGCPSEYSFQYIKALDFNIFFPNAFTPNGDGINDEYYAKMNSIQVFDIQIYNRWGELIYESFNTDFAWDGTGQDGSPSAEGVYVFKANATTYKGETFRRTGSITLIR